MNPVLLARERRPLFVPEAVVAAINVGGQTIHSFFGFKPDVTLRAIRKKFRDEKKNNGGIQLTPVVTTYCGGLVYAPAHV